MLKAQILPIISTVNDSNNKSEVYRPEGTTRSRTNSDHSDTSDNSNSSDNSSNTNSNTNSDYDSNSSINTSTSTSNRGESKRDIIGTARHRLSMQPQPLGHLSVTGHDHGHDQANDPLTNSGHPQNDPPLNTKGSVGVEGDPPTGNEFVDQALLGKSNHQQNDRSHLISSPHPRQLHRHNTAPSATLSSSRQTIQHLTDMGPLEIEREIDSGVHLNHDILYHHHHHQQQQHHQRPPNRLNNVDEATSLSDQNHPSSFTLVSNHGSSHSETALGNGAIDPRDQSEDQTTSSSSRTTWSGGHPLLTDFTTEPNTFLDPDTTPSSGSKRELARQHPGLRHKGHSMSVDQPGGGHGDISFFAPGSTARRRRQRGNDIDRSLEASATSTSTSISFGVSRDDHDRGSEAIGKRVIIHQVAITDTLAGIALYYGIQVPILKKSNKLWTNDSIHTRKYLYIPVDECSVVKQAGMTIDEGSNTVILPQRAGTGLSTSSEHSRAGSTENYGSSSLPGSRRSTFLSENETHFPGSLPPPPGGFSGMAPLASSPRLGVWASKSVIAPPVPSPTITTTTLSAESQGSTPLSSRNKVSTSKQQQQQQQPSSFASIGATGTTRTIRRRSSVGVPFSEHLPNTVVVSPTMTHEALAARFKEMDLISLERKMSLGQEQELRTNPIHHRHRTTDLRQQAQRSHSASSSNAGSRRASVDVEPVDSGGVGVGGRLSKRTTILSMIGDEDGLGIEGIEEQGSRHYEEPEEDEDAFIVYGRHQHMYLGDDDATDVTTTDPYQRGSEVQPPEPILRRQELITVPAGVLSFFPSPQHSKRLETPQSISRLQNRTDSYRYESSTHSSSSSSLSGGRSSKRRDGEREDRRPSKGRKPIDEQTFQAPVASSSSRAYTANTSTSNSNTTAVRVNSVAGPKWSLVSDSIVEDILGAVRGPLEIARRLYVSGFSFGTEKKGSSSSSSHSKGYSQSSASGLGRRRSDGRSSGSQRRRVSSSGGGRRSGHGARSGSTGSGSAIELDTSIGRSSQPKSGSVARRMPSSSSYGLGEVVEGLSVERRKSSSSSGGGPFVATTPATSLSTTATTTTTTGSLGSVRKRSLRSSKPVNHAALKALVNELDRDKKKEEAERDKGGKETAVPPLSSMDPLGSGSSAPTIRFVE
ncbi:MAG: hypothetical protein BYD32DRAFT_437315 [Podila humilis]|nr:MAG: hypothetical protein BYD32DRAFT_437315 [Podila humilis]